MGSDSSVRGTARPRGGQSRALGWLILLAGRLLMPFAVVFEFVCFAALRPGGQKPVWAPLAGAFFGLLGVGAVFLARYLIRQGKRHLSPITTLSDVLHGPPFVLYLRTFTDDPTLARVSPHADLASQWGDQRIVAQSLHTEEEQLRTAVRPFGSMVAVGRPGERLPEVGARRLYLSPDDWQESVLRLMAKASLVVMVVGRGASLRWELAQAAAHVSPHRLVLVVPMGQAAYGEFRHEAASLFPASLPDYPDDATLTKYKALIRGAIYFDADWTAHFVRFDTPGSPGNFQRVIESRFVYGLRPVYERLRADWPGIGMHLPTHAHPTRRQIPIMGGVVTVPLILLAWLLWQILGL